MLDENFIMIKRCVQNDTSKSYRLKTDLLIYQLGKLDEPVVKIKEQIFDSLSIGFFI